MPDVTDIRRELSGFFRHGPVLRDGAEVGLWYVRGRASGDRLKVARLWRGRDGGMHGGTQVLAAGDEDGVHDGDASDSFGAELVRLMQSTGMAHVVDPPMLYAINSEILRRHPGIGFTVARDIARLTVPDGLRRAAERYVSTLDPQAVSILLRHAAHAPVLGRLWANLDGTAGDAPLAGALAVHPGFPGQVAATHAEVGARGMRHLLAEGRLGTRVAERLARDGVPRNLIPLAARAEAALAGVAEAILAAGPGIEPGALHRLFENGRDMPWPVEVALQLVGLPTAWAPRDDAGWVSYAHLVPVIKAARRQVGPGGLPHAVNAGDGWGLCLRRLLSACGAADTDGILSAMHDRDDMVDAYIREALVPAARPAGPPGADGHDARLHLARAILFGGRSLAGTLELSAAWHRRQHGMRAAIAAMPGAHVERGSWPAGLPDATYGDVGVAVLRDAPSLVAAASPLPDAEGEPGLDNCAGTYGPGCMDGGIRVLELRRHSPGGKSRRLSMAEVDVSAAPALVVWQHVGLRNGPAPADAGAALDAYVRDVGSGRLPVDLDGLAPVDDDGVDPAIRACGFDPSAEATRLAVAGLWDPFLPRAWRGIDPAEALRLPEPDGPGWAAPAPAPPGPTP